MIRQISPSAIYMGLLAAFVGYSASFAIVLAGLTAMGANDSQVATGLFFATLGMGICSIWLPLATRIPAAIAWSTPGAAFLAAAATLPGGFAEAVGALICCAVLIVITGFVPALGRLVSSIPKPIANALLAGVIVPLCLAPALSAGKVPYLILPLLLAWIVGFAWHKLAAMPVTIAAFIILVVLNLDPSDTGVTASAPGLPALDAIMPVFTLRGFISIAVPLYLVTMAGQNIPGFAVLDLGGYTYERQPLLRKTGLASLLIAPFGAIPVNMSAITAAMMSGEDAGRDPAQRYWAAVASGLAYVTIAFFSKPIVAFANVAPRELITAVAGFALIPALVSSLSAAFADPGRVEAPALTFLFAASGMTMFGVSGAFWGTLVGVLVWSLKQWRQRAQNRPG
ncbi:MAG: benzoate/H(+) symporter BenE family transporter [Alphaproteobacteria bacterium]|nr:benzoate transporter [Hyphomonas sp.]MBR9806859.1 benzoate/H(+) symporter BenE family transporter [Alphaproteobacteria bacterium]